jgi:hypothetical protein
MGISMARIFRRFRPGYCSFLASCRELGVEVSVWDLVRHTLPIVIAAVVIAALRVLSGSIGSDSAVGRESDGKHLP